MIVKPYRNRTETDPRRSAGVRAEKQMAHYLDRYFGKDENAHLLHDVHIEHDGDRAQIDHLLVHRFGVAIVESKSVSTRVRINAQDEWERRWDGAWRGMPDPLLQAERQGLLLKRLLTSRTPELLDKVLRVAQGTFSNMAVDAFVAISDDGAIQRARKKQAPNARKADAVPQAILDRVTSYRSATSIFNLEFRPDEFTPRTFHAKELMRISHFLRVHSERTAQSAAHGDALRVAKARPQSNWAVTPPASAPATIDVRVTCKACGSTDLTAKIGRYGPYAACAACGKNTSIRLQCSSCGEKLYVKRSDDGFAGTCGTCGTHSRVHVGSGSPK